MYLSQSKFFSLTRWKTNSNKLVQKKRISWLITNVQDSRTLTWLSGLCCKVCVCVSVTFAFSVIDLFSLRAESLPPRGGEARENALPPSPVYMPSHGWNETLCGCVRCDWHTHIARGMSKEPFSKERICCYLVMECWVSKTVVYNRQCGIEGREA